MLAYRPTCHRCLRPASHCYCAHLTPIASRTRVVFLQHPREYRMPIGTARMTNLGLANSELHVGADLDGHPRVRALTDDPRGAALLFPAEGAVEPWALPGGPPATLVVLDGTWIQARKMLARSPRLQRLPRVAFTPARPGRYRIRREPAAHCLATVEAVVQVLGRLEKDPDRFLPLLRAFEQMVAQQLHDKATRPNPYFHAPRRRVSDRERVRAMLAKDRERLVLVHGEANAHAMAARVPGDPELLQLVAERYATGERYEAVLAPRRPLAPSVPSHLELPAGGFVDGEDARAALDRFADFLRAGDRLASWGRFTLDLLAAEAFPAPNAINLRDAAARALARRPGGPEQASADLAGNDPPRRAWTAGRAGRRVAALATIVARVLREP
ncbi:MAG: DTW domain-containing protein [Deltaproteobacteria bacterium]|nr:DTW domain-containing protein [Deltaproteobacteria bacterium]